MDTFYMGMFILLSVFSGIISVFAANNSRLSQSTGNDCNIDRNRLFERATNLAKQETLYDNGMQIVRVTITSP